MAADHAPALCRRGPHYPDHFDGRALAENNTPIQGPRSLPVSIRFSGDRRVFLGGQLVAGRMVSGNVPPFSFIRWFFVALCFLAIGGKQTWEQRHLIAHHWKLLVAFGLFGVVGFTVPYYVGLQFTVAVNASLMNASGTLWIVGTAFLMTGETITRKQSVGVALGFVGTVLIVLRADLAVLSQFSINIGDMMVLVAFFSWAVYTVMLRWKPPEIGELAFLTSMTIFAVIPMAPLYVVDLVQGRSFDKNFDNIAIITYAVVFPSFIFTAVEQSGSVQRQRPAWRNTSSRSSGWRFR